MSQIPEVRKFREELEQRVDSFCSWIEEQAFPQRSVFSPKKRRTPYRLHLFCQAYEKIVGKPYIIHSYPAEGGAAIRTQSKVLEDALYLQAVQAYLNKGHD